MPHPLAVVFIHGIGRTDPDYSVPMRRMLARAFAAQVGCSEAEVLSDLLFEVSAAAPGAQARTRTGRTNVSVNTSPRQPPDGPLDVTFA